MHYQKHSLAFETFDGEIVEVLIELPDRMLYLASHISTSIAP